VGHRDGIEQYTLGSTSCGICHGSPPPAPHPDRPDCGTCHVGYAAAGVNVATHRDGIVEVLPPTISVTPAALDFGYQARWAGAKTLAIAVGNTGGSTILVSRVARCSGTSAEFSVAPAALSVSPGQTEIVSVSYDPADTGADTGCVELASDDPARPVVQVAVTGTSVQPRIPVIGTSPASLGFGTVKVGYSRSLALTVSNPGNATLYVSGVGRCSGTSDEFRVSSSSFSLSPGSSRQLSVSYRPSATGTDSGCIAISSNDPARPRAEVPVSGAGAANR
jgi:hypothetical protein